MLKIIHRSDGAILKGKVTQEIKDALTEKFAWMSATDLSVVKRFYNADDNYMYHGVVDQVAQFLRDTFNEEVEVVLKPYKKDFDWIVHTDHLPKGASKRRAKLQNEFVAKAVARRYCIAQGVPGFGKTHAMAKIIAEFGKRAIVIVENGEQFDQAVSELTNSLQIPIGRIRGKKFDVCDVNVMTIQTWLSLMHRNDPRLEELAKMRVWLIDEAHNAAAETYLDLLDWIESSVAIIGCTATPFRYDDKDAILKARLGEVVFKCSYKQAIDAGILVPMILVTQRMPKKEYGYTKERGLSNIIRARQYRKVLREQIYRSVPRNNAILDFCEYAWEEHQATMAIITDSVEHIEFLCHMSKDIVGIYGKTKAKERKEIWKKLYNKEIRIVATTLMDEATDVKSLGGIALAAPGLSKVKLHQRQRQLRSFSGVTSMGKSTKEYAFTYLPIDRTDFIGTHSKTNFNRLMQDFVSKHEDCRHFDLGDYGSNH